MKVLFLGRIGLLEVGGGDKVQIENTAMELRKLGVEVDVSTDIKTDFSKYDLIHIFQLDWTPEAYLYSQKAKSLNKPLVLSPIHHLFSEVKKYDDNYAFGYRRLSKLLFNDQFKRDVFKNVYRTLGDIRKAPSTLISIKKGMRELYKSVLDVSDRVLVQTQMEAEDLTNTFNVNINWVKVPNGVGQNFISNNFGTNKFQFNDYIICVARIEPRKNQLNIIKAVKEFKEDTRSDAQLVFIGVKTINRHYEYVYRFERELANYNWIHHIEKVPYADIQDYYHYAKVCVSASWFETTGLTSLEALFCGTNSVASGKQAQEYLGSYASYCKPEDISSIKEAIKKEYLAKRPTLDDQKKKEYTWENAAKKTLDVYNDLLKLKK